MKKTSSTEAKKTSNNYYNNKEKDVEILKPTNEMIVDPF